MAKIGIIDYLTPAVYLVKNVTQEEIENIEDFLFSKEWLDLSQDNTDYIISDEIPINIPQKESIIEWNNTLVIMRTNPVSIDVYYNIPDSVIFTSNEDFNFYEYLEENFWYDSNNDFYMCCASNEFRFDVINRFRYTHAVFYINGSFVGDQIREEFSFEELGIKDDMTNTEIKQILEDFHKKVFLTELVPGFFCEGDNINEYIFGVDRWADRWWDFVSREDLNIDDSTTKEEKHEILQNYLINEYLGQMDTWWLIIKKEV